MLSRCRDTVVMAVSPNNPGWDFLLDGHEANVKTYRVTLAADGFSGPNGLVLSADERHLYVSDSRANHIRVFGVAADGALSANTTLYSLVMSVTGLPRVMAAR